MSWDSGRVGNGYRDWVGEGRLGKMRKNGRKI